MHMCLIAKMVSEQHIYTLEKHFLMKTQKYKTARYILKTFRTTSILKKPNEYVSLIKPCGTPWMSSCRGHRGVARARSTTVLLPMHKHASLSVPAGAHIVAPNVPPRHISTCELPWSGLGEVDRVQRFYKFLF